MYHWGPIDLCVPPALLGYFPDSIMQFLVANGGGNVAGGGLYVSDSPQDTHYYGSCRVDVTLTPGTPYVDPTDNSWLAPLLGLSESEVKYVYPGIGTRLPLLNHHYMLKWSVFYSASLTGNATGGVALNFHNDIFPTLFSSMYPVYNGTGSEVGGPKIRALNTLLQNARQIILSYMAAENPIRWVAAALRAHNDIRQVLQPNTTSRDWCLFESVFVNSWSVNSRLKLPPFNPGFDNPAFLELYVPALMGGPVPLLSENIPNVMRDYPYSEMVWATKPYLAFLEGSPFVNVVGIKETMNISTTANHTFSIFKVAVRGISAFESDWKKLFQLGFISNDHPILKLLLDDSICCETNKTQLLIATVLSQLGRTATNASSSDTPEIVSLASHLSWILPFKDAVVPAWMSRSLLRFFLNRISYLWTKTESPMDFAGMSESIQHVRRGFPS